MKIGIIIGSLGFGGAERVTIRLTEWWVRKNWNVSIFTTMCPPVNEYQLPTGANRIYCHQNGSGVPLIKTLRNSIKNDRLDVVIIMDTPMCVYCVPALLGLNVPIIVSERSAPNTNAIKKKTRYLSHLFMNAADGFVFQTNGAKKFYNKQIQNRSVVIENPLDIDALPEVFNGQRSKRIVAVGRLIPVKDYPLLIKAFEKFSVTHEDYSLEIYGDGPERTRIEKIVSESPAMQKICIMGAHNDVLERIADAAVYVLSSYLEGMPNALIEAMALGIPSISTDCPPGGPADLITNMENGLLVPVNDPSKMADAMGLLVDNCELAKKISQNAVNIRERLKIDVIGEKWDSVIVNLMKH